VKFFSESIANYSSTNFSAGVPVSFQPAKSRSNYDSTQWLLAEEKQKKTFLAPEALY